MAIVPEYQNPSKGRYSSRWLLIYLVLSISFVEFGIMLLLPHFIYLPQFPESIIDVVLLTAISFPVLYFFLYKPLRQSETESETRAQDLRKFQLAVANASDHIVITDKDGIIVFANAAASRITGYAIDELMGKKAGSKELWGGIMPIPIYEKFWKTIKTDKKVFMGEFVNHRKNGEQYVAELHVAPVLDPGGEVLFFVGLERDITEAKNIDRAKTEFVSLASHQLRTPLTTASWYSEMLLSGDAGEVNEKQKTYLEEVYRASKRMTDLVNNLLNVSRIEMGSLMVQPEPVSLGTFIQNLIRDSDAVIKEKRLKTDVICAPDIGTIHADPKVLNLILQNLLSNAIRYTPPDGSVRITVDRQPPDIRIAVADTGIGIPVGARNKLFTKMYRADNAKSAVPDGNGLGLYMVKSMIELVGGHIWYTSEVGKGSTFYVTIPEEGMISKEGTKGIAP